MRSDVPPIEILNPMYLPRIIGRTAIIPRKNAPANVTLVNTLFMKSLVGLPGLIPGTKICEEYD